MKITKKTAFLLALVLAALGLSACRSYPLPPDVGDEQPGRKSHVHADGAVHYH